MARSAATMRSRRASTDWSGRGIATDTQALLPGTRGGSITTPRYPAFIATPPQVALFRGSRRASRTHCPFGPLTLQAIAVIEQRGVCDRKSARADLRHL